jgi:hypothetical protein
MIWKRLQQLGVHGRFLDAIMDLYRETKFQVEVNGSVSMGFLAILSGIRQGCPMSPLLFGIFIDVMLGILPPIIHRVISGLDTFSSDDDNIVIVILIGMIPLIIPFYGVRMMKFTMIMPLFTQCWDPLMCK